MTAKCAISFAFSSALRWYDICLFAPCTLLHPPLPAPPSILRQDWHTTAVSNPFPKAVLARPQLSFLNGLSHECLDLAPHHPTPRPSRLCIVRINTAEQAIALMGALPDAGAMAEDVAVVNFGLWYHDRWEYNKALHNFARHVRLHAARLPLMLWMETTAQHFDTPGGEWPPQYKPPFVCTPLQGVALGPGGGLVGNTRHHPDAQVATILAGAWN